ncbi:MAG: HEAT repeat domain-containing protein, partial [Planctomycetota bacterium]
PENEIVLALVDLTLFGSAKNGMLFGQNAIYYRNPLNGRSPGQGVVPYQELPQRQLKTEIRDVYMDFGQFIECGTLYPSTALHSIADTLRQWIQKMDIQEDIHSKTNTLFQVLRHSNKDLRKLACFAVSQMYENTVSLAILDSLQQTLADPEREVRIAAAIGLTRLWKDQISEYLNTRLIQEEMKKFPDVSHLWTQLNSSSAVLNNFQLLRNRMNGWAEFEFSNLSDRELSLMLDTQGTEYILAPGSTYLLGLRPNPVNPFYPKGYFYLDQQGALFFPDLSAFDPLLIVWDEKTSRLTCSTESYLLINRRTASVIH